MYRFDKIVFTTPGVLAAVAQSHPSRTFVIADDGTITYGAMARLCVDLAASLTALGLGPGDRLGILLPNGVRWCASLLAAHTAGLCAVPLNSWYRKDELAAVARRAGLRAVITQSHLFGSESAALGGNLSHDGFVGTFVWPRHLPHPEGMPVVTVGDPLTALHKSPASASADALVLFTSGSSAEPKAVRLTHEGMIRTGHAIGEQQGVAAQDRFWFASPLFFVFGCANVFPNVLTHAATLCVQERFEAGAALEFIERHRCTVYYGVAPITRALAASEQLPERDISALRTGSANATPEDLRLAIEVLGVAEVCNAYGMTEGYGHSTMTAYTDPPETRMQSQGRVLQTQELRIMTAGAVARPDEPGEIQIRGLITPGYLDDAMTWRAAHGGDGWFRTGDIGRIDRDGLLHYMGRSSEMIKVKGINVSPLEIERMVVEHDLVAEAFVFGLDTPEGDQSVGCALVSTTAEDQWPLLIHDVRQWLRARVASYKVPSTIWVITADRLPLTPTGKVSKRMLRQQLEQAGRLLEG